MRALQGHPGQGVSSTVTKRNPRPRKYASASERQAAYRARAPEVCFRAEGKTVDTLDKIAADLDVSRADLLLSMTKFALTNHDWGRFGLTHRPLPYQYGIEQEARTNPAPIWDRPRPKKLGPSVPLTAAQKRKAKALAAAAGRKYPNLVDNIAASRNPSMKKPTPAQIAARERFAEMARSGAFKRKAKRNPAKRSGYRITLLDDNNEPIDSTFDTTEEGALLYAKGKVLQGMKGEIIYKFPKGERLAFYFDATGIYKAGSTTPFYTPYPARAMNPAKRKKTVSQKISQLMHEGYPQKQAVAVALSEQRAGKVKRNPMSGEQHLFGNKYATIRQQGDGLFVAQVYEKVNTGIGEEIDLWGFKMFKTRAGAQRYIDSLKPAKRNPATGGKGSRTKLNPVKYRDIAKGVAPARVQYAVHMPDRPSYHAMAYFTKKADALEAAQEVSDRTGKPVAVSRVQVHFGPM